MTTTSLTLLRAALFATLVCSAAVAAPDTANTLKLNGSVPVKAIGNYVQVGSYRLWVQSHLGKPSFTLADGSCVYNNRTIDDNGTTGAILIRFQDGRVSEMKLVSPAIVAALRTSPKASGVLVAQSHR